MSIAVTGASGHLGRLTLAYLPERGVPAGGITATARAVGRLKDLAGKDLAGKGVAARAADRTGPASPRALLRGADRLPLVSGHLGPDLLSEHRNAAEAAPAAA